MTNPFSNFFGGYNQDPNDSSGGVGYDPQDPMGSFSSMFGNLLSGGLGGLFGGLFGGSGNANDPDGPPNTTTPPPPPLQPTIPGNENLNMPNFNFTSYGDEAYQNLPTLRYLQGNMSPEDYMNVGTNMMTGAFGTQLPLSGLMNMNRVYHIAQNPDAVDAMRSLYRSGNLNYDALVNLARQFAPSGSAQTTSGIFT